MFVPHPDDEAEVREGFAQIERGEGIALTAEEMAAYLHWLETGDAPDDLKHFFETGERARPDSRS